MPRSAACSPCRSSSRSARRRWCCCRSSRSPRSVASSRCSRAAARGSRSAGVVVTAIVGLGVGTLDVRTDATKTLRLSDEVEGGDWGAVFRVDAVQGFGPVKILHHDGLWGSSIWEYDGTPATTDRFSQRRPPDPVGGARPHARAAADHRRRRWQRDPGGAHLRRRPGRRRRAQPGHPRPPHRHVRRVLRQHRQPAERELRAGRRPHVPRPLRRRVRPHLVRRARLVRRLERSDVGRVRAVGELPVHAADDRDRVRPPDRPTG